LWSVQGLRKCWTAQQTDIWYDVVKHFEFEGWAFAGVLRHNFFILCRRIIKMAHENKIQDQNWIDVLGTNELQSAVGLPITRCTERRRRS
jgi:hypothetical protein